MNIIAKKIVILVTLLATLTASGTFGFWFIENWSVFDSLYMTVITLSTVGYHEVHDLSQAGRIFVMIFIICGLGFFFYSVVQIAELILNVQVRAWIGRKKMDASLNAINDHFIICGYGRMGASVCEELAKAKIPFVVIDQDPQAAKECMEQGWECVNDDATDDDVLIRAGIERAKGIAIVLATDADNLYVVVSSRQISNDIQIICRATDDKVGTKMRRAGADRVVSVYTTAGSKMAKLLTNPNLEDFLEVITSGEKEMDLAEILINENSEWTGQRLDQTDLRKQGVLVVGVRKSSGALLLPPDGTEVIETGDHLIAIGKPGVVNNLTKPG